MWHTYIPTFGLFESPNLVDCETENIYDFLNLSIHVWNHWWIYRYISDIWFHKWIHWNKSNYLLWHTYIDILWYVGCRKMSVLSISSYLNLRSRPGKACNWDVISPRGTCSPDYLWQTWVQASLHSKEMTRENWYWTVCFSLLSLPW